MRSNQYDIMEIEAKKYQYEENKYEEDAPKRNR